MKHTYILIITIFFFGGCSEDGTETPLPENEVAELTLNVNNNANGGAIEFLNKTYTIESGEKINIAKLAYILGDFILVKEDGSEIVLDDQYALINPKFTSPVIKLKSIPKGSYKAIKFSLGLDSSINHADPSIYDIDHPLSPVNNSLHWSWTGGYIFMAIEGKIEGGNESYIFHLAGSPNKVDYELPIRFIKGKGALTGSLDFNFDEVFKNPEVYSLELDGKGTHSTTDNVTKKLFANMKDIFTVFNIATQ